jgi:glycosyltransferase involved in cell wall biosynthesis
MEAPKHPAYRVLVVTNMFPHDDDPACGSFVKAQVDALRGAGSEVEVLHIRGDLSAANYVRAIAELRRHVTRFGPDIVYAFYGLSGWVALWQTHPVVLSLAGDDVLGTPGSNGRRTLKSRVGIALSNWAANRVAIVCVQSDEMRERLWWRKLRSRTHVVPYGVDPNRFTPGDQRDARRRLGLQEQARIVLFPNTPTVMRKRVDLAKAAVAIVQRTYPGTSLTIIAGVRHADMPDYYRAADCCLLTSDWEGSPNVVKEALLCGLPVVSTDVGDVRKWIGLSPESIICERTPESLADGIIRVVGERRRVDPSPYLSRFSSSAIASQMLNLFATIVPRQSPIS